MSYNVKGECRNTGKTHFSKECVPWNKGKSLGKNKAHAAKMKEAWSEGCFDKRKIDYGVTAKNISSTLQGIDSDDWKGFTTNELTRLRRSAKYSTWRSEVMERDKYTCQHCGASGVYLEVHHMKSFAKHPELRFEIDNGLTVCIPCHGIIDKKRKQFLKKELEVLI